MTDRDRESENRQEPLPGVPDVNDGGTSVPPVGSDSDDHTSRQTERITNDAATTGTEECYTGGQCTCGAHGDNGSVSAPSSNRRAVADGGAAAANVDGDGSLGDIEFTRPAEGVSQDIEHDSPPDERVGVPEDVDLDTPGYSIRAEMNDIETPDDKTWFMELDTAVIDEDRCIQCGTCVAACPSDSIGIGDDGLPELVKMCTGCSLCWDFCPRGGLRYERQWKDHRWRRQRHGCGRSHHRILVESRGGLARERPGWRRGHVTSVAPAGGGGDRRRADRDRE